MEDVLHILLGAALALLGSFVTTRLQGKREREERDIERLLEASQLLLEHSGVRRGTGDTDLADESIRTFRIRGELSNLALQIRSKKYRDLAVRITQFSLDSLFRSEEQLYRLLRDVQKAINKEMIAAYESEMSEIGEQVHQILDDYGEISEINVEQAARDHD